MPWHSWIWAYEQKEKTLLEGKNLEASTEADQGLLMKTLSLWTTNVSFHCVLAFCFANRNSSACPFPFLRYFRLFSLPVFNNSWAMSSWNFLSFSHSAFFFFTFILRFRKNVNNVIFKVTGLVSDLAKTTLCLTVNLLPTSFFVPLSLTLHLCYILFKVSYNWLYPHAFGVNFFPPTFSCVFWYTIALLRISMNKWLHNARKNQKCVWTIFTFTFEMRCY